MCKDSILPLVVAIGTAVAFIVGGMFFPQGVIAGTVIAAIGLLVWFWRSAYRTLAHHHPELPGPHMD
jgi:hypothetical protein